VSHDERDGWPSGVTPPRRMATKAHPLSRPGLTAMPRLLILLTLPPDVIEQYRVELGRKFPGIEIEIAATPDKAATVTRHATKPISFLSISLRNTSSSQSRPSSGAPQEFFTRNPFFTRN